MAINFLNNIDVTGEVKGTSLDINGNADISGTLNMGDAITIPQYINHTSDGNTYFGFADNDTFRVGVGGTQRLNIATGIELTGNTTLTGTLTVGVDDTGYDVKFFGATSGASFLYDESEDRVTITGPTNEAQLELYTISGNVPTVPQLKIGRSGSQYWGVFTGDRDANVIHRQDESSGQMKTNFQQWDNNTSDTTGVWQWQHGDGSGGSLQNVMVLDQGGNLSGLTTVTASGELEGGSLDINGNADISGSLTSCSFASDYNFADNTNFMDGEDTALISFTTGALTFMGASNIVNGILDITNTTDSSDATGDTGALRCEGGASIAKKLFAGSTITGSADVIAYSDERLKENVKTLDGKKVLEMRGVSFDRVDTGKASSGVIAQEIEKIAPELVIDDGNYKGVAYGNLVGYLIEAIKDQQKQIDELKEMCNGCSK